MTCSRCLPVRPRLLARDAQASTQTGATAALLFCLLAFFGCDSNNPGGNLEEFEGRYSFTTYVFTSPGVEPANVVDRLDPAHGNEIEIDGSGNGILRYRRVDEPSRIVSLDARVAGGVLILTPEREDDADSIMRELLFPTDGTLQLEATGGSLSASRDNFTVNLHEFDPDTYGPSLDNVKGTLTVTFTR